MKLPPYICLERPDYDRDYEQDCFILETTFPFYSAEIHHIGKRILFSSSYRTVQLSGFNIYLSFKGQLGSLRFCTIGNPQQEIDEALARMANWYLLNIVGQRPSEFERFRM